MSGMSTPRERPMPDVEDMSVEELRRDYVQLKVAQYVLQHEDEAVAEDVEAMREQSVRLQQNAEIQEEFTANQLIRQLDDAKKDADKYEARLREEKQTMQALESRVEALRVENEETENELEQQQEYLMNQIQKKLSKVSDDKARLERELLLERQRYLDVLMNKLTILRGTRSSSVCSESGSHVPAAKDSFTGEMGRSLSASARPEAAPSLTSSMIDVPPPTVPAQTHEDVVRLEDKLNKLLMSHAKAMHDFNESARRSEELTVELRKLHDATFLDRARAAKLKADLAEARSKLTDIESVSRDSFGSLSQAHSQADDGTSSSYTNRSFDPLSSSNLGSSTMSLRDRTRELLSSAPPPAPPVTPDMSRS